MPLTIGGEDKYVSELHERLLSSSPFEVGIVIGCASASKHTILRLVRSPDPDGGRPPRSAKEMDAEWVGAHAQQANHALPGGVAVLGMYVCAKTAEHKEAEGALAPQLRKLLAGGRLGGAPACLLALPTDSRKLSARACVPLDATPSGAAGGRMDVAELKLGKAVPPLYRFEALWHVDAAFALRLRPADSAAKRAAAVASALTLALRPSVELLKRAVPTVDGLPVPHEDAPVAKLAARARIGPGGQPCSTVRFYARSPPVAAAPVAPASGAAEEAGACVLLEARCAGTVHARAYASAKEGVGAALHALRADAARSLERRVQLLREALADAMEEGGEEGEDEVEDGLHVRPGALVGRAGADVRPLARRRMFDRGLSGGVCACDLSLPDDEAEELAERLALLGGAPAPPEDAQPESAEEGGEREAFATCAQALASLGAPAGARRGEASAGGGAPGGAARATEGGRTPPAQPAQRGSARLPAVVALLVALLAVLGAAAGLGLGRGAARGAERDDGGVLKVINYPTQAAAADSSAE